MTIDGKDIFQTYDVQLSSGTYSSLLKYPKRTTVAYKNYADRDGIIPDLRKIDFEPSKRMLNFLVKHNSEDEFRFKYQQFFDTMNAPGYREMNLGNGLIHLLRYDQSQKFDVYTSISRSGATILSMQFIEDKHAIPGDITMPTGNPVNPRGIYEIGGIDFCYFGVTQNGRIGDILKYPEIKEAFYDYKERAYFTGIKTLKHKQVTIPLLMRAESKAQFIHNYIAFFNQFNRTGKLRLYLNEIGGTTEVYYVDCPTFNVHWNESYAVWATFSITLVIPVVTWLDGQSVILTVLDDVGYGLLADEEGRVIVFMK